MNDRGDELHFLLVPFGQFLHFPVPMLEEGEALQPSIRFSLGCRPRHASQLGKVEDGVEHLALPVESPLFRKVAQDITGPIGEFSTVVTNVARRPVREC